MDTPPKDPPSTEEDMLATLLRAPKMPGMKILDRAAFAKRIPTVAAYVKEKRDIQSAMKAATHALLRDPLGRTTIDGKTLYEDEGNRMFPIALSPAVKVDGMTLLLSQLRRQSCALERTLAEDCMCIDTTTLPIPLAQMVKDGKVELERKDGTLTYDNFGSEELLKSILPPDYAEGVQHGFTLTGHIAHLNFREQYLPYKHIIAEIILDKNAGVETVSHKTEDVGSTSEFRTMPLEIIAGRDDTNVTVRSSNCTFKFDFATVYWNSRLENEHDRVAAMCKPGEAVCDVMAGVGPFAIPAAKHHRALVWANDLNKCSYDSMVENIKINRVTNLVQPFNADGRDFIRSASRTLVRDAGKTLTYDPNPSSASRDPANPKTAKLKPIEIYTIPAVFSRFIMNLPASAVEFLDAFIGLYAGQEHLFQHPSRPHDSSRYKLPIVHVYTFNRAEELEDAAAEICTEVSRYLQYPMRVDGFYDLKEVYSYKTPRTKSNLTPPQLQKVMALASGESPEGVAEVPGGLTVGYVRGVGPNKHMYCVTFRLPPDVAFRMPVRELSDEEKAAGKQRAVWERSDEDAVWPGELSEKLKK
ncbi:tRNA(m(1)G37)methyltransferase [Orbilia brochopaga]|uniref:tRNA (guanine(37)-N1)-methyltransferase n=1 Tax=Orbilia brochopaga TaxID=3140254 RepID=A0AAV9UDY2_9PEZI